TSKLLAMEMERWLSLYFIGISTVLALWFLIFFGSKRNPKKKQLPPGPWTLPIIGSLHHLVGDLPHRRMMKMSRQHGPLMHLRLGEVPTVIVSSAEAAALVMKTNDLDFASRPRSPLQDIISCGGMGIIFGPYGDRWRQMRKICIVELLSSKQVRRMEGIKANEVGNLLHSMATAGATVNVSAKMATLSSNVVTRAVFGGKFTRQDEYLHELSNVNELMGSFCLVDLFPSSRLVRLLSNCERLMRRSYGRIQHIITEIIEGRKAARAAGGHACSTNDEDLLDVLLRLQQEDSLTFPLTTEIIGVVIFVSTFS
uniref:Cytochrome P450 n=1 Tax=Aegilops tauschii subsp. strangulata TaxID=200361 RepID=A0A453A7F0_AEGTS